MELSTDKKQHQGGALPELITAKEAASILRVHYVTMLRYCRQKKVLAKRVGGEWRVDRESLLAFDLDE